MRGESVFGVAVPQAPRQLRVEGYRRPHRIVPLSHHGLGRECRDREGAVNSSVRGRLPPGRPGPELPHDSVEHRQVVQMRATSADRQPADPQADRFALGHRGEGPARAVRGGQAAVRCEVRQMSAFTIRRQSRARWSSTSATPLPSRPYLQGTWATTRGAGSRTPVARSVSANYRSTNYTHH